MATPEKDPITCHVLNTVTGRPAAGIKVTLLPPVHSGSTSDFPGVLGHFTAVTNADGRILNWKYEPGPSGWTPKTGPPTVEEVLASQHGERTVWKLKFETADYYGDKNTFFPFVEVTVFVKKGEHHHVPLLMGPYSYTTYRGS
jgi:5-hydroxyisourate hydrolase